MKLNAKFVTQFSIEVDSPSSIGSVCAAISRGLMAGDGVDEYGEWSFIERGTEFASADVEHE